MERAVLKRERPPIADYYKKALNWIVDEDFGDSRGRWIAKHDPSSNPKDTAILLAVITGYDMSKIMHDLKEIHGTRRAIIRRNREE